MLRYRGGNALTLQVIITSSRGDILYIMCISFVKLLRASHVKNISLRLYSLKFENIFFFSNFKLSLLNCSQLFNQCIKQIQGVVLTCQGLSDDQSVRSALVRILVVFIKRQWPNKWPSMLEELQNIGQHGVSNANVQNCITELYYCCGLQLVCCVEFFTRLEFHCRQLSRFTKVVQMLTLL